jgi:hypothetical protein
MSSSTAAAPEERACRICYGSDEANDPLFQPCQCTGSMAFVHASCLDAWRNTSSNRKSFYECDTCKFKYRFGSVRLPGGVAVGVDQMLLSRLLGSRFSVHGLSAILLALLIFVAGFVAKVLQPESYPTWRAVLRCFNLDHLIAGASATGLGSFFGWAVSGLGLGGMRIFEFGGGGGGGRDNKAGGLVMVILVVAGLAIALSWIYGELEVHSRRWTRKAQRVVLDAPGRVPHID